MTRTLAALSALFAMTMVPVSMRSIEKGGESQIDGARQVTVRTSADWEKLWAQHAGERARPAVDFGRETVVAVFLGSRPTAGFSIEIVGVEEGAGVLTVRYRETRPAPGAIAAQVLTSPFHIVAVPSAAAQNVRFERIN